MEDSAKRGVVKGVLFFSALVIGAISLYTTFVVFAAPEHLSLSPEDYLKVRNETRNETNSSGGGDSFVIDEGDDDLDKFVGGEGSEADFKTETIPATEDHHHRDYRGLINPLVIYEDVKVGKASRGQLFLLLAILEIIVIYFVYRRVEGNFIKK